MWPTTKAFVNLIDGVHSYTGLPWWATLSLTAVGELKPLGATLHNSSHGNSWQAAKHGATCNAQQVFERPCCLYLCSRCGHRLRYGPCGDRRSRPQQHAQPPKLDTQQLKGPPLTCWQGPHLQEPPQPRRLLWHGLGSRRERYAVQPRRRRSGMCPRRYIRKRHRFKATPPHTAAERQLAGRRTLSKALQASRIWQQLAQGWLNQEV